MLSRSAVLLLLGACATTHPDPSHATWTALDSGVEVSLRGLAVVSRDVAWASGADGVVLLTRDGGATFARLPIRGAEGLDLRSIHAFDDQRAVVVAAGSPARAFRTVDGGASWSLVLSDDRPAIFLDGIAFCGDRDGWIVGDPIDGRFVVLRSDDGGASWHPIGREPHAEPGEAAFAASGTAVACAGGRVRFATGGAVARVVGSDDDGSSWQWARMPMAQATASRGVFSLAFADARLGVAVGGDHLAPDAREGSAAFTVDGGRTWHASERPPAGYRSCVAIASGYGPGVRFAVGTNGADASDDGGRTWRRIGDARAALGHHAIAFAPASRIGFAVGPRGRISRIGG
ncbi:MAG: hypothetical protein HZB39_05255 [Planctomycetes bacterium]|nr:hypothetical protein [Planctomycetota bacterium]